MVTKSKLYKAQCSRCGRTFRRKTRTELLAALRKHLWKQHRAWMIARIKAGRKAADKGNPSIQDLVSALGEGKVRASLAIRRVMTPKRYQTAKVVLDALEPVMPTNMKIAWLAVQAVHDIYKGK